MAVKKTKIPLKKIREDHPFYSYSELGRYIKEACEQDQLRPVKNSGLNGKNPPLYNLYWKIYKTEEPDKKLIEELKYTLSPLISPAYYLVHMDQYKLERKDVLMLNRYLNTRRQLLGIPESVNERSFEIWGREKFLSEENGNAILRNCGISQEFLNTYRTFEPLSYYSQSKKSPQTVLFLENNDPFYSMRKFLKETGTEILGREIGTLIYGGGKRILSSINDFKESTESHLKADENTFLYFGDLDYEGIMIFEHLTKQCPFPLEPFREAYTAMITKWEGQDINLPYTKDGQKDSTSGLFFSYFPKDIQQKMKDILERGLYIPQEILNVHDF